MTEYAALFKTPHALADGLMLVFQHPANEYGPLNAPSGISFIKWRCETVAASRQLALAV
jgi:hypothetical protein